MLAIAHGYNIPTILSGGLWVSGLDPGGNGKFAASTVYKNTDWATGPCSDSYDATYDSLYDKIFKVSQSDIAYHIDHYQDNGYQMPVSISQWPGNGRTAFHEQQNLAPYVDANHNGVYDPQNGDYPNICGDEAIFFMLNDARNTHTESQMGSLGVQLGILVFDVQNGIAVNDSGAINSTLFMKLNLVNCSTVNYTSVLFSLFSDYRIGCYLNDRAGCDTVLNSFFGYNDSYPDSGCSSVNSGDNKVAQGIVFLNQKLFTHAVFRGFTDTVSPQRPDPPGVFLRNFQSGFWYDDITEPFTVGSNGFGGQIPTHYIYPGDPLNPSDWSDMTSGTVPGERAGIGTVNLDSLSAGQSKNIDIAFVSSFVLSSDTTNEITALKQRITSVQNYYSAFNQCGNEITGIQSIVGGNNELQIFPNPTGTILNGVFSAASSQVTGKIFSVDGKILKSDIVIAQGRFETNISSLDAGLYILVVQDGVQEWVKRFVKE